MKRISKKHQMVSFQDKQVKFAKLGEIEVDSGSIGISDSMYLPCEDDGEPLTLLIADEEDDDDRPRPSRTSYPNTRQGVFDASLNKRGGGQINNIWAVVSQTAYGDGGYPVYQMLDRNGLILGVFVDFVGIVDGETGLVDLAHQLGLGGNRNLEETEGRKSRRSKVPSAKAGLAAQDRME